MAKATHYNRLVSLIDITLINPIEGHSEERVNWLRNKIEKENIWTVPVCVDKQNYFLMDGHHRFQVAKKLKLKKLPCYLYEYSEVKLYSLRSDQLVSFSKIKKNAELGIIYPEKTAKHEFPRDQVKFSGVILDELR